MLLAAKAQNGYFDIKVMVKAQNFLTLVAFEKVSYLSMHGQILEDIRNDTKHKLYSGVFEK